MHVKARFDLCGKSALVTGRSRGLGLGAAVRLGEAGGGVAITWRGGQLVGAAGGGLRGRGAEVLAREGGVVEPADIARTVAATVERFGGIDVLVNNAGLSWAAPSLDFPRDKWELTLGVNLTGVWLMSQAVAPHLIARGGGAIVNVSSMTGQLGMAPELQDTVAYNASKGGVDALTRDLAVKWARHGIRVNAIAPGYFHTRLTDYLVKTVEDRMTSLSPLGRLGHEGELKGAGVFLCSAA